MERSGIAVATPLADFKKPRLEIRELPLKKVKQHFRQKSVGNQDSLVKRNGEIGIAR